MKKASKLIIKIAEDGELSVSAGAALDRVYQSMFEDAYRNATTEPENVEHCIKTIIFGCFWIEASTNEILKIILNEETRNEKSATLLWESLKRSRFQEKFRIISLFAYDNLPPQFKTVDKKLKACFELRNRLAHFKDDPQIVSDNSNVDDVDNLLATPPDSDLVKEISLPRLEDYVTGIGEGAKWLSAIEKKYVQSGDD